MGFYGLRPVKKKWATAHDFRTGYLLIRVSSRRLKERPFFSSMVISLSLLGYDE